MRRKSHATDLSSERGRYSAEEKIRIVLDGLRGEHSIAEVCRREGIAEGPTTAGRRSSWKPASDGGP